MPIRLSLGPVVLGSLIVGSVAADEPPGRPVTIAGAEQFEIRSQAGPNYRIFVARPAGEPPADGWPVLYLTDGNSNFSTLVDATRRQSFAGGGALIVGVGYPSDDRQVQVDRRAVDLVPKADGDATERERFLGFLVDELRPKIGARYRVDSSRLALFGHSHGAHFALHVLFERPDAFGTYIAVSPSIWYGDGAILADAKAFVAASGEKAIAAKLLLTVGEAEGRPDPNLSPERARLTEQRRKAGNLRDLAAILEPAVGRGLTLMVREYPEEGHGTVILPSAGRGVRFFLEGR